MGSTLDICAPAEQTEGTRSQVLRWLKAIGDEVSEHEPLIELETDKVTVEVAAPASGILREIMKGEQEEIAPGDVLGRIETAVQGAHDRLAPEGGRASRETLVPNAAPPGYDTRAQRGAQSGQHALAQDAAQAGNNTHAEDAADSVTAADGLSNGGASLGGEPSAPPSAPGITSPSRADKPRGSQSTVSHDAATAADALTRLSPAVRRLIAERGLDPSTIRGSGEGGRITVDDVIAHDSASRPAPSKAKAPTPPPSSTKSTPMDPQVPSHFTPHTAIRKRIADHMVQSLLHTAPHVTTVFEAKLAAVIAHRASSRAAFEQRGAPLTFTAYFLAASVAAIRAVPEANSRWTDSSLEIYDTINIGVAAALEAGGLVVPVLRNVESRSLFDIAQGLHSLVTAAREGRLQPSDVRGGTFTISNHGVSGSLLAMPIVINQPQSAILGVGKLEKRAVVVERNGAERIIVEPKCYVTLTIDHRVMDGHQANRFLQAFVKTLEAWPAH